MSITIEIESVCEYRERKRVCKKRVCVEKEKDRARWSVCKEIECMCVCVCVERQVERECVDRQQSCYTCVTLFITSLLRILWHFVRIPAFTVECFAASSSNMNDT